MKKVFFTAIAMIAFSSASMANTIADEEVVAKELSSCQLVSALAYNYGVNEECMTHSEALAYSNTVYFNCVMSNWIWQNYFTL